VSARDERDEAPDGLTLTAGAADAGTRLDRFLAVPVGSRSRAQSLIESDRVRVDGARAPKRHALRAGQVVVVDLHDEVPEAPADDAPYDVVYEDKEMIVVDKPAGVVVHPARGHRTGTLAQALSARGAGGGEPWRAGIVHRLDRDTSGLLVVAKNDAVHRVLKDELARRRIRREYLALVDGRPPARTGTIDAPIGRHRQERTLMSVQTDDPREARTHFEIVEALSETTLLRVVLDTGRTHQIRVHMAAIGHPVSGDHQYGGASRYGLTRQFLHAARLVLPHPVTGETLDLSSPLPNDLASALEHARAASTS
jgi:23S rRNA pseudouridine1911/1915/1917 synthase